MIGVSTEFAIAVTNWIATIAHSVCRQLAAEPAAGAEADCAFSSTAAEERSDMRRNMHQIGTGEIRRHA